MQNSEFYYPSEQIVNNANVTKLMQELGLPDLESLYKYAIEHREEFWAHEADRLDWFKKWDKVLDDSQKPFYKWFVGGKINIVYNAIDRHLKTHRRNKLALIWEGENGEMRTFSYHALNREVTQFANILKAMGVRKGDTVTIYMPQIPEQIFAMLATAKLGAIHSVVYGGFSSEALLQRIKDAKSKVVITADGGYRRGKIINLKETVNEALRHCSVVETVITVKRTGHEVEMITGRDFWFHELKQLPLVNDKLETVPMEATDILFILYTSGSTGKPKALVHTHGGYAVYTSATHRYVFDIKEEDRFWTAADPGWITGHSYIVYGPLINGATIFSYEGAPDYPYPDRWWRMVEKYGINILYTSPTAIRGLMRYGESWIKKHDISSLRLLGSVGEPINPEAWKWYYEHIGRKQAPIMDTWWQTETGGHIITPLPVLPLKPGSATRPFLSIEAAVVDEAGNEVKPGQEGYLVLKSPWPGMAATIYGDPERYVETYWKAYEKFGWYYPGDAAKIDEDGYFWIIGRVDDVIKVSGYRLGTAEIESAIVAHPAVSEAAVIGLPHEIKGNAIHAYVILKHGESPSESLADEIKDYVKKAVGPIAKPEEIHFVDKLPKTRSGKIMRRVLRAQALGKDVGDLSTLAD